jgi:hypothetical protein
MIYKILEIIRNELNEYFKENELFEGNRDQVILGNIALLDSNLKGGKLGERLYQNIVLSLVRIAEEETLKNQPDYRVLGPNTVYKKPPVVLNLFLLITAGTGHDDYFIITLQYLSRIIEFFQSKRIFNQRNTIIPDSLLEKDEQGELEQFEVILDIFSPSLEDANHIWGTLGGRQLPHVFYKLRLVHLERDLKQEERGVTREIILES